MMAISPGGSLSSQAELQRLHSARATASAAALHSRVGMLEQELQAEVARSEGSSRAAGVAVAEQQTRAEVAESKLELALASLSRAETAEQRARAYAATLEAELAEASEKAADHQRTAMTWQTRAHAAVEESAARAAAASKRARTDSQNTEQLTAQLAVVKRDLEKERDAAARAASEHQERDAALMSAQQRGVAALTAESCRREQAECAMQQLVGNASQTERMVTENSQLRLALADAKEVRNIVPSDTLIHLNLALRMADDGGLQPKWQEQRCR